MTREEATEDWHMRVCRKVGKGEIMYVYIKSGPGLWTVGFYRPDGSWEPESDHDDCEDAATRTAWLNGGHGLYDEPLVPSHGRRART